ncbi:hypothetical protein Avbf_17310 [Armadillidium vulgare]|nr:hypothetical protein Avbf_17310 [Armadillidium vulgare]
MQKLLYISNGVQLEIDRVIVVPLEILNRHCRMDEQLFCQSKRLENKSELTNRHTIGFHNYPSTTDSLLRMKYEIWEEFSNGKNVLRAFFVYIYTLKQKQLSSYNITSEGEKEKKIYWLSLINYFKHVVSNPNDSYLNSRYSSSSIHISVMIMLK